MRILVCLAAVAVLSSAPARAELPSAVITMVVEAYRSGDDATIAAIMKTARKAYPDDVAELERLAAGDAALLADSRRADRRAEEARIRAAGFLDIWKGQIELGASRATGNNDTLALYAAANLTRDALQWRQKLMGRIDYQRTEGATTADRVLVSYQPNYKFREHTYTFGLAQYEHDSSLGYSDRYTAGAGLGYDAIDRPGIKLSVEGGPAFRRTVYTEQANRNTIAARASLSGKWSLSDNLALSQEAAGFIEQGNRNASLTTALDTKLIGALKARFSYNLLYEHDAPEQKKSLDTLSRATLVYTF